MSRVGLADNSHSAPQGVADRGSRCPVIFPQAAVIMNVNLGNQYRHGQFASIPAQAVGTIRKTEVLSAGRVTRFVAGPGYTGFELTHFPCLDEAIPTLQSNIIED
jgi:hypothetical protein